MADYPLPGPATPFRTGPVVWYERDSDNQKFGVRVYTDDGKNYTAEYKRFDGLARTGKARLIPAVEIKGVAMKGRPTRSTRESRAEAIR